MMAQCCRPPEASAAAERPRSRLAAHSGSDRPRPWNLSSPKLSRMNLRCDAELFARNACRFQRFAGLGLVAIHLRRVEGPVSDIEPRQESPVSQHLPLAEMCRRHVGRSSENICSSHFLAGSPDVQAGDVSAHPCCLHEGGTGGRNRLSKDRLPRYERRTVQCGFRRGCGLCRSRGRQGFPDGAGGSRAPLAQPERPCLDSPRFVPDPAWLQTNPWKTWNLEGVPEPVFSVWFRADLICLVLSRADQRAPSGFRPSSLPR